MDSEYDPALFEENWKEQWEKAEEALLRPPRPGEFLALVAFLIMPFAIGIVVQAICGGAGRFLRRLAHA